MAILAVAATAAFKRHGRHARAGRAGLGALDALKLSAARLQSLGADEFHELCKAYYHSRQFRLRAARTRGKTRDAVLYFGTLPYPVAIVRIIVSTAKAIDEDAIRDLTDVMSLHGVAKGIVHVRRGYTDAAMAFARVNRIRLVSGEDFVRNITGMPEGARVAMSSLLTATTSADAAVH